MITLADLQKLFPARYNVTDNTNIRKILEVIVDQFADVSADIEAIKTLKDIATITGKNLTEWAASYGIDRGTFTDDLLRILLNAALNNEISGSTVTKLLNFTGLLYTNFHVVELYRDDLGHRLDGSRVLDGTHVLDGQSTAYAFAAFDVIIEDTILNEAFLQNAINDLLKAAGVKAYINLLVAGTYGAGRYGAEYYGQGESGNYPA